MMPSPVKVSQQGEQAARAGVPFERNPYHDGCDLRWFWLIGWWQAFVPPLRLPS